MGVTTRQATLGVRKRTVYDADEEGIKPELALYDGSDDSDLDPSDSEDGGSDSSDDEDEDKVGICEHREDEEPFPACPAYDDDLSVVIKDLVDVGRSAVNIIDESEYDSSRVQSLRASAIALSSPPRAKPEKIALLGDTGTGKSSILNSLLDRPDMAKAIDSGQSCTFVATEYEGPFPDQAKPLAARIEYFDMSTIEALLRRMLNDYYTWHFRRPEDCETEELEELHKLSSTAEKTFRSLFCDRQEFESPTATTLCLEASFKLSNEEALAPLLRWCEELLGDKEFVQGRCIEYLAADTEVELNNQLSPLVFSSSQFKRPAMWPLVKKVRVGVQDCRILKGTTLVDLPGLNDTNKVRVDASLDILRSCESIWIVAKIGRIVTDTSVDNLLMRYGKSFRIAIICTGIDEHLDDALATHLKSEGQSIGDHDELLQQENHLRSILRRRARKIESYRTKLDGVRKRGTKRRQITDETRVSIQAKIDAYTTELEQATKELPKVAKARFDLLVDVRNSYTMRRLRKEKIEHLPKGTDLDVFCVSNTHYAALKGRKVVHGPRLSADDTGIPILRAFALRAAAPSQLQAVEDAINHRYTVFLRGLSMFACSYSIEGGDELLAAIRQARGGISHWTQLYATQMQKANETYNVQPILQQQAQLTAAALAEVEKKRRWNWQTVRAFVRRDGNHKTTVALRQSWNEQFQAQATKLLSDSWDDFLLKQELASRELKKGLCSIIHSVNDTVQNNPASTAIPIEQIKETLEAQLEGIRQACREFQKEQEKELRNIKLDLTQDRHTGYFTQAMSEVYASCKDDRGDGVNRRTLAMFANCFKQDGKKSPFSVMTSSLAKSVKKDVHTRMKALLRQSERILDDIYQQFDDMLVLKMDDSKENELRRELQALLGTAEDPGPVQRRFEKAKKELAELKERYES